jgi:hypothetical protein
VELFEEIRRGNSESVVGMNHGHQASNACHRKYSGSTGGKFSRKRITSLENSRNRLIPKGHSRGCFHDWG